ncbi:hypothetical protein SDC9_68393 [bioreactor metagenome]|uniref:Uncharacterized protein n=1 Tax=bioreactor metagenome TaxID=1076179 RepID=A0A644Y5W0_9ZZZZ
MHMVDSAPPDVLAAKFLQVGTGAHPRLVVIVAYLAEQLQR